MTMKKFLIIFAAVAVAMTACNKKPADEKALNKDEAAVENVDKDVKKIDGSKMKSVAKLEKVGPTEDGKDHSVAQFKTAEYDVTVDQLANGTMRVALKGPKGDQNYESNNCRKQGDSFLMQTTDGKNILLNAKEGKIVILNKKEIIYSGIAQQ